MFILQEKLEKSVAKLKGNKDFFNQFIYNMDKWLVKNSKHMLNMFKQLDVEDEGTLTYDEFKSGMS